MLGASKTRIRAKIGPHEFEADGDRAIVLVAYEAWLAAVAAVDGEVKP